jgi:hypothetical protein
MSSPSSREGTVFSSSAISLGERKGEPRVGFVTSAEAFALSSSGVLLSGSSAMGAKSLELTGDGSKFSVCSWPIDPSSGVVAFAVVVFTSEGNASSG